MNETALKTNWDLAIKESKMYKVQKKFDEMMDEETDDDIKKVMDNLISCVWMYNKENIKHTVLKYVPQFKDYIYLFGTNDERIFPTWMYNIKENEECKEAIFFICVKIRELDREKNYEIKSLNNLVAFLDILFEFVKENDGNSSVYLNEEYIIKDQYGLS